MDRLIDFLRIQTVLKGKEPEEHEEPIVQAKGGVDNWYR